MTYELAKKLKDAGFPQTTKDGIWNLTPYLYNGNGEGVHAPELSELVEACGAGTTLIYISGNKSCAGNMYKGIFNMFEGTTLEEATANLWMELKNQHFTSSDR